MFKFKKYIHKIFFFAMVISMTQVQAQECGIWYVTPNGNGTGTKASPASFATALSSFTPAANQIWMAEGYYPISNTINMPSDVVIEGSFNPTNWLKSNALTTVIHRDSLNPDLNPTRLVAFECISKSNFEVHDLKVTVANADTLVTGFSASTYGFHIQTSSNYNIVRVKVFAGNATKGLDGTSVTDGRNGGNGGDGGKGCKRCDPITPPYTNLAGAGGNAWSAGLVSGGNGGNGAARGTGEDNGLFDVNFCNGTHNGIPVTIPDGNPGSNGLGVPGVIPGLGGNFGLGKSMCILSNAADYLQFINDSGSLLSCVSSGGTFSGQIGEDGDDGSDGNNGLSGFSAYNLGYFVPGDGQNGQDGKHGAGGGGGGGGGSVGGVPMEVETVPVSNANSPGAGGGGGGEGGEAGKGGKGGKGGGSSFGIFVWDNGLNGNIKDCTLSSANVGQGGLATNGTIGGQGGNGGLGGFDGGAGGSAGGCEGGRGGDGGKGGKGGNGGNGGNGANGESKPFFENLCLACVPVSKSNVNVSFEPEIRVYSKGCTNSEVQFVVLDQDASTVITWNFGAGSNPLTATTDSAITTFDSPGRKLITLTINGIPYRYTQFIGLTQIGITPDIATTSNDTVCPNTAINFTTATIADSYIWKVTGPSVNANFSTQNITTPSFVAPGNYLITLQVTSACCGLSIVDSFEVTVLSPLAPSVSIIANNVDICPGENVSFFATALDAGTNPTYQWLLNGNPVVGAPNLPNYSANNFANGDKITVSVTSAYLCAVPSTIISNEITLNVFTPPTINCPASQTTVLGTTSPLSATVSGGLAPYSYVWDLGNGFSISGSEPTTTISINPTFGGPNTYTSILTITDAHGCSTTCNSLVTVIQPVFVEAKFTSNVVDGCDNVTVNFTDQSLPNGAITSWTWDFGDGTTSNAQNPSHFYANPGLYTVSLIVVNNFNQDTAISLNYVEVYETPKPTISTTEIVACEGLPITFIDGGSGAVSRTWNFGDGSPTTNIASPSHIYTTSGPYTVTLDVVNFNGVCPGTQAIYNLNVVTRPIPDFTVTPDGTCNPVTALFTNNSSANGGTISGYEWDFGDGDTTGSTLLNPVHIYPNQGVYSVRLIVTNTNGCSDTLFQQDLITVNNKPLANFTASSTQLEIPNNNVVTFTDNSTNASTWLWNFGRSGQTFNGQNPSPVTFNQAGIDTVTLFVTDPSGCSHDTFIVITTVEGIRMYIPNVFSPNGDGLNDLFKIDSQGMTYNCIVFDRWGKEVYNNANNVNDFWNGSSKGGSKCPEGVYVFQIVGKLNSGEEFKRTGSVTLVR